MRSQGASETWLDWLFAQEGRVGRTNAAAGFAVESVAGGSDVRSIKGGNDRLPYALASALGHRVKYSQPGPADRAGPARRQRRLHRPQRPAPRDQRRPLRLRAAVRAAAPRVDRDAALAPQAGRDPQAEVHGRRPLLLPDPHAVLAAATRSGRSAASTSWAPTRWPGGCGAPAPSRPIPTWAWSTPTCSTPRRSSSPRTAGGACPPCSRLFHRLLPGIRHQVIGVAHKAWQEDRWAGGGWGWTQPGELRWMLPAMRAARGPRPLRRRAHVALDRLHERRARVRRARRPGD